MQVLLILLAFLCGAFPSAVIVGRVRGINVLQQGSGNPGATNTARTVGLSAGLIVLLLDIGKVWFAVALLPGLLSQATLPTTAYAGAAAVIGHTLNPFLRLRGGRGVATSAGVLAAIAPQLLLIPVLLFAAVFAWRRRVSEASLVASLALLFSVWVWQPERAICFLAVGLALLIGWTHRANLRRILGGTEPRLQG